MSKPLIWGVIVVAVAGAALYATGAWRALLPDRYSYSEELPQTPVPAKPTEFELHSEPELTNSTRTLLSEARHEELERQLEHLRQEAARDPAHEHRLIQAYGAFDDAETRTSEEIDAWIRARPASAEALIARAGQRIGAAWKSRGRGFSKEVADEAMVNFERLLELAAKDAEQALVKMPEHPVAWVALVRASCGTTGSSCLAPLVKRIDEQAPASYIVHKYAMNFMQPRWGGSYKMIEKYAEYMQKHTARNPRLAILRGVPFWAAGEDANTMKDYPRAFELYDRAMAFGEDSSFLEGRGNALVKLNRYKEGVADLRRRHERWQSTDSAKALSSARERMREAAYHLHREKEYQEALEAYDAYLEIWPDDDEALFYRARLAADLGK